MGKSISDVVSNANRNLEKSHKEIANQPVKSELELLGHNNLGYPVYKYRGTKVIHVGFFATEEQFKTYYQAASDMIDTNMRTPSGENVLQKPDVNALVKYSTDFFVHNISAAKHMSVSDIRKIGMELIKQMPKMMR